MKLPVSELLRRACLYAEQDRRALIEAMSKCTSPEDVAFVKELKEYVQQLRAYRRGRWGKSASEKLFADAKLEKVL